MTTTEALSSEAEATPVSAPARRNDWTLNARWDGIEPKPVAAEPPPGFWKREASHAPIPFSPLTVSVWGDRRSASLARVFETYGVLAEGLDFRQIGGWEYAGLIPLGGKEAPRLPRWLTGLLLKLHPAIRARNRQAERAWREDVASAVLDRWLTTWRSELETEIRRLQDVDLEALSDAALLQHWDEVDALADKGIDLHFQLHGALANVHGDLAFAARDLLGWDDLRTLELLSGLSAKSTEPAERLAELGRIAAARPEVIRLVRRADAAAVAELRTVDPEFASRFDDYQREFGVRGLRYEIAELTLREAPEITLATIRDQIDRGFDAGLDRQALEERRRARLAEASEPLDARTQEERTRFQHLLQRAEASYGIREDNEFYTISAPLALVRYFALEIGRRLAQRGQLEIGDDVFFLRIEEAIGALQDNAPVHAIIEDRKAERAWVLAHPGPDSYGVEPAPPPLDVLPPAARRALEITIWYDERINAKEATASRQAASSEIEGISASPGVYQGTVRVVMDESQFHKIQAGDVLVCPVTSPVWSVLFARVGALVTDKGGVLSHPAIIAREYRVPAVVGTGGATGVLEDGMVVEVDGTNGRVRIL